MKLTLIFLGSTGAGPAYAFEMAKALRDSGRCELQLVVARRILNLERWEAEFENKDNVRITFVETYKHSSVKALLSIINIPLQNKVLNIVKQFGPDVVYFPFGTIWGHYLYRKLRGFTRVVNTMHDPHPHYPPKSGAERIMNFVNKANRYVNDIVILNKKDVDYVKKIYKKGVLVIPHASFGYYKDDSVEQEFTIKNTIGFIGRIEPYKGVDILVEAYEKLEINGLELIIAGSGSINESLKERINDNSGIMLINRYIPDEEIPDLLKRMDILVLPYRNATQSGVIPLAFSFGKTVIATNVGALDEQVPEGTGSLIPVSVDAIAAEITKYYTTPDLIKRQGENAKKYADEVLTWSHSAELLLNYISE